MLMPPDYLLLNLYFHFYGLCTLTGLPGFRGTLFCMSKKSTQMQLIIIIFEVVYRVYKILTLRDEF